MAFDEKTAARLRAAFDGVRGVDEKRMFGGLAFMVNGHMCCGLAKGNLMVRVGPDNYDAALALTHARPMDFTGKPLRGMVYVDPPGFRTARQLAAWVKRSLDFVNGLPAKKKKKRTIMSHRSRP